MAEVNSRTPAQQKNVESVKRLFEVIHGDGKDFSVLDEVVAEDYIQHNPLAGAGREGLRAYFTKLIPLPDSQGVSGIVQVNYIVEGSFVVRQEIRTHGLLIDIFRAEDGILLEHWDAYRPEPGTERYQGF